MPFPLPSLQSPPARLAILGASGYTGAEAVRLVANHPGLVIAALTGESNAGKPFGDVFPHLAGALPAGSPAATLSKIADVDWASIDAAFCCLPHATTQATLAALPTHIKVVDLSADFRLADTALYEEWYGTPHAAPGLQAEAVYGLTELARPAVASARLVANPGCYPTAAQLPLVPLVEAGLIDPAGVIIDAKSGVSGAGRGAKVNLLYTEVRGGAAGREGEGECVRVEREKRGEGRHSVRDASPSLPPHAPPLPLLPPFSVPPHLFFKKQIAEGINPYGVTSHRHMPEIEQGLTAAAVKAGALQASDPPVRISFTPHLMPMARGMLVTIYAALTPGSTADDARAALASRYEGEAFVKVLPAGAVPHTRYVRGTNAAHIAVAPDRLAGRVIVMSALDNLMKGASGQALQNLNLMMGWGEGTGLAGAALFP